MFWKSDDTIDDPERHVFAYGSAAGHHFGHLVLRRGGRVLGYENPREHSWSLKTPSTLCFHDKQNEVTGVFKCKAPGIWVGTPTDSITPLYLIAAFSATQTQDTNATVLVNTIPKAGTYLLEAALSNFGVHASRIHLSGADIADDYRGLPDQEIHRNPMARRLSAPLDLIVETLRGQMAVGHIEDLDVLRRIANRGSSIISVRRNLRDAVISMYRFKLNRVCPTDEIDASWRNLSEPCRFIAFMLHSANRDFVHMRDVAFTLIHAPNTTHMRFEDTIVAHVDPEQKEALNRIRRGLGTKMSGLLQEAVGAGSPTYSGEQNTNKEIWSDEAERIFEASGLGEANRQLGYE